VVRTRDSEPLLHTHFVEHIAADLGFIVLSNGDFRASRNHGEICRPRCGFERIGNNDLVPSHVVQNSNPEIPETASLDLSLFVAADGTVNSDLSPRRS
jgi:hypothetical protein